MQKSLDIFKAEPQSVFDVICECKNTGFYMPAYQRPYSWEESHIRDLFSDCENVFRNLLESPDAIIFLGSILSVDDSSALTVYPLAKKDKPTHIKLVIDGQQRLSTLILIILCLNERLSILLPSLKKAINSEQDEEIKDVLDELRQVVSQLQIETSNTVVETTAEHEVYKYLPKIIRSQVDCWGRNEKRAQYESPISELLCAYQRHIVEQRDSSVFKPFDLSLMSSSAKRVVDNVKEIRKQLDCVQKGFQFKSPDGEIEEKIKISDLVDIETLDVCLDFPIDEDLAEACEAHPKVAEVIYIAAFTKFLLHRVCLTYVEVNNESYAFDMFEALNTTGEPLTAIETFVPKVIEHIGNKRREGVSEEELDASMEILNSITERFENIIKSKEKNDKTKALILAFVRAYEGKVKVTSLRDQRDAMLKSYENCLYNSKDEYLTQLATTADFLFDHWQAPVPDVAGLVEPSEQDISNLCLRYLVDMKHDIVQSLLVQFILVDKKFDSVGTEYSEFAKVLKAVTAFSVLWRAMSGGADGIDGVYKKLHERGMSPAQSECQLGSGPITSERFNAEAIKSFFREELEVKINSKGSPKEGVDEMWLDICSKQQILTKPKSIKMLLLSAMHGIELNGVDHEISDKASTCFLTTMMWELVSRKDAIKKVFNGGSTDGWGDADIANPEEYNKIGNVLIDARNGISSTNPLSWYNLKQHMLQALSNESINNIDDILLAEGQVSDGPKRNASLLMLEKKFEDITFAEQWKKQQIDERSALLLTNAWRNLTLWLD
ncbi:conserved hypothetical protein [Vibrio nigripulchritudo SFn27]|uniref:GmrSD restriction endonucleases N-terminal domain-containing protein n=1 Tax=Vibrio nigripulchritudo TaxID=28173 RepID=U4KG25_9VIBR|nr:DUF262 domain-containing protein [Vibrio nigripulchritudo]CCN82733.1 conserved hypothetical protein [Vibrio nigripulchritudo BLFn1]CCN89883.1 conserved hypothetical protein [Vibrio nigripulchritudo SFn27]CCN92280.1 conserved hypothetical protein [Vibrio nigripulchritudo ENn2]CCO43767.1 conserved hypothetical protein [Vibrio nigripulchritudo SFn135]CCO53081.1 conserved hypothetical protein [Vibrio nigripulchritudo Wn13]